MFLWIDLVLTTAAIVALIICYVLILAKLKAPDESSENKVFTLIPQKNDNMSQQRRMEMLEKIKEEKIQEYYNRRKRKTDES